MVQIFFLFLLNTVVFILFHNFWRSRFAPCEIIDKNRPLKFLCLNNSNLSNLNGSHHLVFSHGVTIRTAIVFWFVIFRVYLNNMIFACVLVFFFGATVAQDGPPPVVTELDLTKYVGRWYQVDLYIFCFISH